MTWKALLTTTVLAMLTAVPVLGEATILEQRTVRQRAAGERAIGSQTLTDMDGLQFAFNTSVTTLTSTSMFPTSTFVSTGTTSTSTFTFTTTPTGGSTFSTNMTTGTYSTFGVYTTTGVYTTGNSLTTCPVQTTGPYTTTGSYSTSGPYSSSFATPASPAFTTIFTSTPTSTGTTTPTSTTTSSTFEEQASGAASDASFTGAVPSTTSGGSPTTTTLTDAFDGYAALFVDGTVFNDNGMATLECSGREIALAPQTFGNIEVSRKLFVPANDTFARWQNILTNNGGTSQVVTVRLIGELGSGGATEILGSSSGDMVAQIVDQWVATGGSASRPRLGHVFQGDCERTWLNDLDLADGSGRIEWEYVVDIAAGETVRVLHFVTGKGTNAEAMSKANDLKDVPDPTGACMTPMERNEVVNFPAPVPVSLQGFEIASATGNRCRPSPAMATTASR